MVVERWARSRRAKAFAVTPGHPSSHEHDSDSLDALRPPTAVRRWPNLISLVLAAAAGGIQIAYADSYYGATTVVCAGLEATILVLLLTRFIILRPNRLPWIEIMFATHYSNFGLAVTIEPHLMGLKEQFPREHSFDQASLIALVSGLAMIGAFALSLALMEKRIGRSPLLAKLDAETLEAGTLIYVPLGCLYLLLSAVVPSSRLILAPVTGILQTFVSLTSVLAAATITYLLRPRLRTLAFVFLGVTAIGVVTATSSMLGTVILPGIAFFVVWWHVHHRVPVAPLLVLVAVVVILQPVKGYYRGIQAGHRGETSSSDVKGVLSAWEQAFSQAATDAQASTVQTQSGSDATIDRLGELSSLAYVVERVPESLPYASGWVYPKMLETYIPRVFWPDKPNVQEYTLNPVILALDMSTPDGLDGSAVGITLTAQGYYEHGLAGSIGWMVLFGAAAAAMTRFFETSIAGTIGGVSVLAQWGTAAGTGFVGVFGGLPQMVIGGTLLGWILWLFGGGFRRVQASRRVKFAATTPANVSAATNGSRQS